MSEISSLNDYLAVSSPSSATSTLSSQELGKDDFLNLLVAELSNQNPLEPLDNKDLILQLAQFSSLEGTQNLNENMEKYITTSNLGTAASLIGKDVVYLDSVTGLDMMGAVQKVNVLGSKVSVVVDGVDVPMNQVKSVFKPADTAAAETQ